ncbi:MAG: HRDC domain-containing protein [Myxococcota bacterium]
MPHHFVTQQREFEDIVEDVAAESRFGLDTEFETERSYFPKLALIQIAWRQQVALIDPLAVDCRPLRKVLQSEALAVIHAASQDLVVLTRACGCVPTKLFDPQLCASYLGYSQPGLSLLVKDFLGIQLDKGDQLANWSRRPLSTREQNYATADVVHLLELQEKIVAALRRKHREQWALEENEVLRCKSYGPTDPETAWWKIRGKGKVPRKNYGVAQAVFSWRETTAQERNRPIRSVLPDLPLQSIVQRPPLNRGQLDRVRGMDRRMHGDAEHILAAVQRGLRMEPEELRLPPEQPRDERRDEQLVALCLAWTGQVGDALELDKRILGTRDDVKTFLGNRPSRLDRGWRRELLGNSLQEIREGEVGVIYREGKLQLVKLGANS